MNTASQRLTALATALPLTAGSTTNAEQGHAMALLQATFFCLLGTLLVVLPLPALATETTPSVSPTAAAANTGVALPPMPAVVALPFGTGYEQRLRAGASRGAGGREGGGTGGSGGGGHGGGRGR